MAANHSLNNATEETAVSYVQNLTNSNRMTQLPSLSDPDPPKMSEENYATSTRETLILEDSATSCSTSEAIILEDCATSCDSSDASINLRDSASGRDLNMPRKKVLCDGGACGGAIPKQPKGKHSKIETKVKMSPVGMHYVEEAELDHGYNRAKAYQEMMRGGNQFIRQRRLRRAKLDGHPEAAISIPVHYKRLPDFKVSPLANTKYTHNRITSHGTGFSIKPENISKSRKSKKLRVISETDYEDEGIENISKITEKVAGTKSLPSGKVDNTGTDKECANELDSTTEKKVEDYTDPIEANLENECSGVENCPPEPEEQDNNNDEINQSPVAAGLDDSGTGIEDIDDSFEENAYDYSDLELMESVARNSVCQRSGAKLYPLDCLIIREALDSEEENLWDVLRALVNLATGDKPNVAFDFPWHMKSLLVKYRHFLGVFAALQSPEKRSIEEFTKFCKLLNNEIEKSLKIKFKELYESHLSLALPKLLYIAHAVFEHAETLIRKKSVIFEDKYGS